MAVSPHDHTLTSAKSGHHVRGRNPAEIRVALEPTMTAVPQLDGKVILVKAGDHAALTV
jgi:hypothetical protein